MTYSYTQISQFLACPRRYRYRYIDGWQEKDTGAALLFGRAFEQAVAAVFRCEDSAAALYQHWGAYRHLPLQYPRGESWDQLVHTGIKLLELFVQDGRVEIPEPETHLQVKLVAQLSQQNDFVSYIDAIGRLDHRPCLIEWKTSGSRYPEQPEGLLALDPQLVCYSWMSGIADVACVVFVRKRFPEIQYLRARITDRQREEFGFLVNHTIGEIETGGFLPHAGIRFPQNGCVSCPHLGLCLGDGNLVTNKLIRKPGAMDLDWLNGLE